VRAAERRDLDAIVSVSLACARARQDWAGGDWQATAPAAERRLWWERLGDDRTWVGVAEAGLTLVGCASFWPSRSGDPHLAYLAGPFVDPEWWGEGIGAALHAAAVAALEEHGYGRVELVVEAGDRNTRGFLEHEGWRRTTQDPQRSAMALLPYGRPVRRSRPPARPG